MAYRSRAGGKVPALRLDLRLRVAVTASTHSSRLSQRESLESIRRVAATLRFLTEHGIERYGQLEDRLRLMETRLADAQGRIEGLDAGADKLKGLIVSAERCHAHREIAQQYAGKTLFKEGFYRQHKKQIDAFLAGQKQLKAAGLNENIAPTELRERLAGLGDRRMPVAGELRRVKDELTRWRIVHADVKTILGIEKAVKPLRRQTPHVDWVPEVR